MKFDLLKKLVRFARYSDQRKQLDYLLESADPQRTLPERLLWLEQLMTWVRTAAVHPHDFDPSTGQLHNVRLRFLLHLLERNPSWKANFVAVLGSLVRETSALTLFAQIGLGQQRGFIAEASERLLKHMLPRPSQETELSELFLRIFTEEQDALWVSNIPSELMAQLVALLETGTENAADTFRPWAQDLRTGVLILGARMAALSSLPEIQARQGNLNVDNSPFLRLNYYLNDLVYDDEAEFSVNGFQRCLMESEHCRTEIQKIYTALERVGVSVSLVYTLENLTAVSRRIDTLLRLLSPAPEERSALLITFLSNLVHERLSQQTLRELVRTNLHLISRKIVERAGATGEHYITRTRPEYFKMVRAGLGGGGVMVGTTMVKFFLTSLKLALFFEGLFFSINYSLSFVVLPAFGIYSRD